MKQLLLVLAVTLPMSLHVMALEPSLWSGLQLEVQALPAPMKINGLAVTTIRFVGSDAEKLEHRWLSVDRQLPVRTTSTEFWRLHSTLHQGTSEVLQVRTSGKLPEAIWSSMQIPASAGVPPDPRPAGLLPRSCEIGLTTEGPRDHQHFLQYSAICKGGSNALVRAIGQTAQRRGYRVTQSSNEVVEAEKMRSRLTITVLPDLAQRNASRSVVLVLERDVGARE